MALITCIECGKEISDKAPACIGCGAPISSVKMYPAEVTQVVVSKTYGLLLKIFDQNGNFHYASQETIFVSEIGGVERKLNSLSPGDIVFFKPSYKEGILDNLLEKKLNSPMKEGFPFPKPYGMVTDSQTAFKVAHDKQWKKNKVNFEEENVEKLKNNSSVKSEIKVVKTKVKVNLSGYSQNAVCDCKDRSEKDLVLVIRPGAFSWLEGWGIFTWLLVIIMGLLTGGLWIFCILGFHIRDIVNPKYVCQFCGEKINNEQLRG